MSQVSQTNTAQRDPRSSEPRPPQPQQSQSPPGSSAAMQPQSDYGETSYRGHSRLTGKAAVITGADSGIGRAVALAYAREGANVLISYLNEEADARESARLVESAGRRALLMPGDVGDERHCQEIVARALQEYGRLDILVSNAAFQMTHEDIGEISAAEFDHTFRTNSFALFYLSKAAIPSMKAGSAIIATASIQAFTPSPTLLPYAATNGAIVDFVQALSQMVGPRGIRVNAVAPGPVWTPLISSTMPVEQVQQFPKQSPLGRPAQPAELAPVYVLLASDEGSYLSGEVYGVTGGHPLPYSSHLGGTSCGSADCSPIAPALGLGLPAPSAPADALCARSARLLCGRVR